MIFVTSDLHFNHANIIKYCNRPYANVDDMNRGMIESWNKVVTNDDEVYVLGDFAFWRPGALAVETIFEVLKGKKHLVRGNHDERNKKVLKLPWLSQKDITTIHYQASRLIACHYPLETWKQAQHGYLHIHGHSHGSLKRVIHHRWDIGVDPQGFTPVRVTDVIAWGEAQEFNPQDHHGD